MRIPIYTSKAPMQGPIVVEPSAGAGTEVAEAIGGFARTVGGVATDWANKIAETEGQSDYVTAEIEDAKNQAEFFKAFQDDPNPSDNIKTEYEDWMQKKRKDYVWRRDFAKKKFTQTSQLSDVNAIQKLNNADRHKRIESIKNEGNINIAGAIELGGLEGRAKLKHAFVPLEKVYGKHELEKLKIDSRKAFSLSEATRLLKLDPNADLSGKEFDNIKDEKAGLISKAKSAARAEANRLKAERKENEAIYFEQTNDAFDEAFKKNELTSDIVDNSTLPTKGEGGKNYWRKKLITKAADETNEKASDYIRKRFALETITSIDIDSRQDQLTKPAYDKFKSQYKARDSAIAKDNYIPSVFAGKADMFTEELDRLVENGTVTRKEAEEAKLKLPEQLHDRAMKENFTERQITDYSEFLIGSYLLKESQIRRDTSAFWKFINTAPYKAIPELVRSWRREKRVEGLPTESEFPTEEVEEEAIEIEGISPEHVSHLSDWLKKNGKVVNEKNIRYLYEQLE